MLTGRITMVCLGLVCLTACTRSTSTSENLGQLKEGMVQLGASNVELNRGEAIAFGFHPTAARATVSWTGSDQVVVCPPEAFAGEAFADLPSGGWGHQWRGCVSPSGSEEFTLPAADGQTHHAVVIGAQQGKARLDRIVLTYTSVDQYGAVGVLARPPGADAARLWIRSPRGASHRVGLSDIKARADGRFRVEIRRNESLIASFEGHGSVEQPQLRNAKDDDTSLRPLGAAGDTILAFSKTARTELLTLYLVLGFVDDAMLKTEKEDSP
jgi:hypothetical protein